MKCMSNFCLVTDGIRGREFEPRENAEGLEKVWCSSCIRTSKEITFFTQQTATMIREAYKSYVDTNLPREVKLILEQFAAEIIKQLGAEL